MKKLSEELKISKKHFQSQHPVFSCGVCKHSPACTLHSPPLCSAPRLHPRPPGIGVRLPCFPGTASSGASGNEKGKRTGNRRGVSPQATPVPDPAGRLGYATGSSQAIRASVADRDPLGLGCHPNFSMHTHTHTPYFCTPLLRHHLLPPHFTDRETEVQKGTDMICSASHSEMHGRTPVDTHVS